ncbi:MAG: cytochrome C biogenesis protein, partial [Nitrosopumilus sp.]|nr:cytochrome C biogenesis protein [Nitrosopumilus sp.]
MIPAFIAYISGTTLSELNQKSGSKTISINRTNIV